MNESTKKFGEKLEKLLDELDREPELAEFLQEDLKRLGDAIKRSSPGVLPDPTETIITTTAPPDLQFTRYYPTFEDREFALDYISSRGIGFELERVGDTSLKFKVAWKDGAARVVDYDMLMSHFSHRYRELNEETGGGIELRGVIK